MMTVILYRDHGKNRRYRWTEKAGNGEPVARSAQGKGYASPASRKKGLIATARGFGLWLSYGLIPNRDEIVRLRGVGTITCGKQVCLVMTTIPDDDPDATLIIRNDDDK